MCGASIEAQGKESSPSGESVQPKRARQNTVNQPPTEFVNAVDAIKAKETASASEIVESDDQGFDPLRDYLDDDSPVESATSSISAEGKSTPAPSPFLEPHVQDPMTSEPEADFDLFADDDDDDWLNDLVDDVPEKKESALKESSPEVREIEPETEAQVQKSHASENRQSHADRKGDNGEARVDRKSVV